MKAKKWNGSKWIRPEKRLAIYIRDGFCCQACGTDLRNSSPDNVTLDHLTPRSQGGGNDAANLVTLCKPCNSSRQDRDWETFYPGGAIIRVKELIQQPLNLDLAKALIAGTAGSEEVEAVR